MPRILRAALAAVAVLALSAGSALAADCYLEQKPVGAGAVNDDGHGAFFTFEGIDFFVLPNSASGLPDTDFGKALPDGARNSGPSDGCGYGVDSYEACVLGG